MFVERERAIGNFDSADDAAFAKRRKQRRTCGVYFCKEDKEKKNNAIGRLIYIGGDKGRLCSR